MTNKDWPQVIKDVGFEFSWYEEKVWALDEPMKLMDIEELEWHFDVPFLWHEDGVYNLTPRAVIEDHNTYRNEYERTMSSDTSYPIDIMENKGRWVILDGLHRLMKLHIQGAQQVQVRVIPRSRIPEIVNDE